MRKTILTFTMLIVLLLLSCKDTTKLEKNNTTIQVATQLRDEISKNKKQGKEIPSVNCKEDSEKINISIKNNSLYDIQELIIDPTFTQEVSFGQLKAGESTCVSSFKKAYHINYVKAMVNGKEFLLQPYDYASEKPLTKGKYQFEINISDFQNGVMDYKMIK